jgi:DNA (cytosine-5)-methyltransferase 1
MRHGSLFSGFGGFDLAAMWMGWENIFHCEKNKFCQELLKYYWPKAELFKDILTSDFTKYANEIDVLSGGFPCQPFSVSGEQQGADDIRFLYPEMLRAIREVKPRWVVAENVRGLTSPKFSHIYEEICSSLEIEGYKTLPPLLVPASAIGADHERYRLWFVAHSNGERYEGVKQFSCNESVQVEVATKTLAARKIGVRTKDELPQPLVISRNNGIPVRLDNITFSKWREQSISGFGNAVVPQIPYQIFKAIEQYEQTIQKTKTTK